ncbi:hypothetical protein ACFLWR_00515 [Chloroflexota bacterium]
MTTVFESISDGFYTAFFKPDPEERREAIDTWIKESTPIIQSAVENDLRSYLEALLAGTWEEKGWKARAEKFYGRKVPMGKRDELPFIDAYKLSLNLAILKISPSKDIVVNPMISEVREKTNEAIEVAKTAIAKLEPPPPKEEKYQDKQSRVENDDDDDYEDGGHSPNDDRSDSMNPNNDDYQASMDNRSDQMNPNNDAYWSSRGR